jgi:flagellar M-ring protein FliF
MERLLALRTAMLERWAALGLVQRVGALTALAALVTAGIVWWASDRGPTLSPLFSRLSPEDAGAIVERLREDRVTYELDAEGTTVLVPEERVHELRLALAADGLPRGGGVGFELFDETRFGESEFTEQVQYRRALEGELARTIAHIEGVERARVHLVLPQRTLLTSEEARASASVALHLRAGHRLEPDQVRGLVHLVASSVRGLTPENVTLVDGDGRSLSATEDESGLAGAAGAEALRERIARTRERAAQELLDATLGPNVAVVRVTAEVTVANEEHIEEIYDPERTATRSFELTSEGTPPGGEAAGGIPGAVSALPGGAPLEPTPGDAAGGRRTEVRNFEVTKVLHRSVEPALRLSRLSVAVLVDGTWEGEGDARTFVPRSAEELARIREIVASATGVVDERDRISVDCVSFAPSSELELGSDGTERGFGWYWAAALAALLLVGAGGAAAFFVRRRRQSRTIALSADPLAVSLPAEPPVPYEDAEIVHTLALDYARRDPELAARVIKGWLAAPAEEDAEAPAASEAAPA